MPEADLPPNEPDAAAPVAGGLAFTALTAEQLAPLFPRLEIGEAIAIGGMGAVYRARQLALDRPVALKILPPELCADVAYLERFRTEARAMAQLNHPNLVGVYDFGEVSGYLYFVMEYVEGQNLHALLQDNGHFGPEFALPLMQQVCDGMEFAHNKGVAHLDLKPGNIMLDNAGTVKILDFGLAKLLDPSTGSTHEDMGTPHYAAPERYQNEVPIDHRADIFSMGIVLFEMLVGKVPNEATGMPPSLAPEVIEVLNESIQRCTRSDPAKRFQTAAEVKADLAAVEKKITSGAGESPAAGKLLVNNTSPQVAAAAEDFQSRLRQQKRAKGLRNLVVMLVVLSGLVFGAWKMNLIPAELLAKVGLASEEKLAPMFPELKKLYEGLRKRMEQRVEKPRERAENAVAGRYEKSLDRLRKSADAALLEEIDAEAKRFADTQKAAEKISSNGDLAKLQNGLATELAKVEDKSQGDLAELLSDYDNSLKKLLIKLEKEGRTEAIERVDTERERIAADG